MNRLKMVFGVVLFGFIMGLFILTRYMGKLLDLPPIPKENWILIAFCVGMIFLKMFQWFCMERQDRYFKKLKEQNKEDGYNERNT